MTTAFEGIIEAAVALRHELHQRPEIAWAEHATARTIRARLDDLGIGWRSCADTGTVATLAPDAPGRHVALRADIDAMPVVEATGCAWASRNDGMMHACGHDGHMAALWASAAWLVRQEAVLPGPVTLLFQPAEEGGHGARRMIEDGALDDVVRATPPGAAGPADLAHAPGSVAAAPAGYPTPARPVEAVFGWHNWPAIPFGQAACPDGPVMSANGTFTIEVLGVGGHASQPEATRDPVVAAAAITLALQQVVARRLPAQQPAVVAVTSIEAPSALTVTPERAVVAGSIRVGDTVQRDAVLDLIAGIAADTARAYGVSAMTTPSPRYDATVNHPAEAARMRDALRAELGDFWHSDALAMPIMASEDFSYYLQRVPGAFALIGADDGRGHDHPCHSSRYDFNDALIPIVVGVYARLAGAPTPSPAATGPT